MNGMKSKIEYYSLELVLFVLYAFILFVVIQFLF